MGGHLEVLNVALRILTFASLVVSVIVSLTATSVNHNYDNVASMFDDVKLKFTFKDFYAYRYTIAVNGIGIFYSFLQFVLAIMVGHSEDQSSDGILKFNVYFDEIMSILLGTGAATGFGLTLDLKHLPCTSIITKSFLDKMLVASSFSIGGFASTFVSSIVSLKIFEKELDVCC